MKEITNLASQKNVFQIFICQKKIGSSPDLTKSPAVDIALGTTE